MTALIIEPEHEGADRTSVLKEYFEKYLITVRCNKAKTVAHYFDALNNISRRLKEKNLVKENIYEIADIEYLSQVKEILYADPDFTKMDDRGNRMYSAGLNNYYRFALGEGFAEMSENITNMDMPVEKEKSLITTQSVWKRSGILRNQVFVNAGYKCELDSSHETFISESTRKPYMEGHHAVPMSMQDDFSVSLDVYANIICLCPLCHRKIHYGLKTEKVYMLDKTYEERTARLENCCIQFSKREFVSLYDAIK